MPILIPSDSSKCLGTHLTEQCQAVPVVRELSLEMCKLHQPTKYCVTVEDATLDTAKFPCITPPLSEK